MTTYKTNNYLQKLSWYDGELNKKGFKKDIEKRKKIKKGKKKKKRKKP